MRYSIAHAYFAVRSFPLRHVNVIEAPGEKKTESSVNQIQLTHMRSKAHRGMVAL